MWRPNPKHSKEVIFRCFTFDDNNTDDYGNPLASFIDTVKTVEVYPYSDIMKREAIGITNEEAYTVILDSMSLKAHDVVVMNNMVYRIKSKSQYEPLQLIVTNTKQTAEQYMPQKA